MSGGGRDQKVDEPKCRPVTYSKGRPQEVAAGADAQNTDHRHPDAGHDVYATLGEGTDAAPLAPTAAQEGVEAEGEGDETGEDEEQASC